MSLNLTKLNELNQLLKKAEKLLIEAQQEPDEKIKQTTTRQARHVVNNGKRAIRRELANLQNN